MKKLLLILFSVVSINCYCQNPLFTGLIDNDDPITLMDKSPMCYPQNASQFWSNPLNFLPNSTTPVITVHLNFVIIQDGNFGGNYPNNQDTYDFFQTVVNNLNYTYANLVQTNSPACFDFSSGQPSYIQNIKIQFDFSLIFKNNASYWGSVWPPQALFDEINNDPTIQKGVQVILTQVNSTYNSMVIDDISDPNIVTTSWATYPSTTDMNNIGFVVSPNNYTKYIYAERHSWDLFNVSPAVIRGWMTWGTGKMLAHELGHNFGLDHYCLPHYGLNQCIYSIMHQDFDVPANWLPPVEIGKMWFALYATNMKNYVAPDVYFANKPFIVSSYQLWNYNTRMYNDIIVENNGVLELKCNLQMPEEGKIIVKPGGKLIVNGGVITSWGNYLWRGIQVWGTTSQHQYTINGQCYQGIVEILNGATIEKAEEGITNWKPNDWSSIGGIIHAINSNFINNRRAVAFMAYNNFNPNNPSQSRPYNAYFKNCNFETTTSLPNGEPFAQFVSLWKVKSINFLGCKFKNSNPNAITVEDLGIGIGSIDASYNVSDYCTNPYISPCPSSQTIKSQFTHLYYGVVAGNAETNNTYTISNSEFTNCAFGIYNSGVNTSRIINNKFTYQTGSEPLYNGVGVYNASGTGYTIEENQFSSTVTPALATIGVYMHNTGPLANQIYKNTFNSLTYGMSAVGTNRDGTGTKGLQFLCNTLTGSTNTDIFTNMDPNQLINGVRTEQGSQWPSPISAGNKFSTMPSGSGGFNIKNMSGWAMNYFYGSGTNEFPSIVNNNVSRYAAANNTCLSHNNNGNQQSPAYVNAMKSLFDTEKATVVNLENQLNTLIDGGNTDDLANQIWSSWSSDTWQLLNDLLSKSPYLSEKVLIEAMEKPEVLPNALLFQIYRANPDALNSDELLKKLSEKNNPMPDWMIDSIKNSREILTCRSYLEGLISFHETFMEELGNDIVKSIVYDTNGVNHQELQLWLGKINSFPTDIMAINSYCETGDYQSANLMLNNIPTKFKLNENEVNDYETFVQLLGNLEEFRNSGKNIYQLVPEEVQNIRNLAEDGTGIGQIYAQNICRIYGYIYEPQLNLSDDFQNRSFSKNVSPTNSIENESCVKISPNPAIDWFLIKWKFPVNENKTNIEITNSIGVSQIIVPLEYLEGERVIDTREWKSGIYHYKVIHAGNVVDAGKIIINK